MSEPTTVDVAVRFIGGTYQTVAINGVKASCTAGDKQAAERFGQKYWGPAYLSVEQIEASDAFKPAIWRVSADPKAYAWCWASGLIEIHDELPGADCGAVAFAAGPKRALQPVMELAARHGKGVDDGKLLVPGVPEAKSQRDGMTALILWVNHNRAQRNGSARMHGVVFGRGEEL